MALIKQYVDLHNLPGNAYSKLGFLTVVSGVTNTNNQGFFVGDGALQINPNYNDTQSGTHATQTVDVRDTSAAFSVKVTKQGVVTVQSLTNPEQVILFQLSKDKGTTSGVNLVFADGALAVTAKTNNNGKMAFSITDGGTSSADWFYSGSRALNANKVYDLADFGPNGGKDLLNESVNSQGVKDWTGGVGPDGQTYTLTTNIETVPQNGFLAAGDTVTGVNNGAGGLAGGSTIQSGDVIKGNPVANSTLALTEVSGVIPGASVVAAPTVTNVQTITHTNISGTGFGVVYNEALYTGVKNENIVKAAAGAITQLTNASASTVFGDSAAINDVFNIGFAAGTSGATLQVSLGGAGTATAASTVAYVPAAAGAAGQAEVASITLTTAGTNNTNIQGTTSTTSITVTGAGVNTLNLLAGSTSATKAVTIDVSAATGNQTVNLNNNLSAGGVTIKGTTGTSTTTVGLTLPAFVNLPTITNVDALTLNLGSNGALLAAVANTSITTLNINDVTAAANANAYNLIGINGINSIVWGTTGNQNNNGGRLTLTGTGTLTETFGLQTTTAHTATDNLVIGDQALGGYTAVNINVTGGVGSLGNVTLGASAAPFLTDTALTSLTVTNPSLGALVFDHAGANAVNITTVATPGLASINLGAVAGNNGLGTVADRGAGGVTVNGADLANSFSFVGAAGNQTFQINAGGTASVVTVTLGNGTNSFLGTGVGVGGLASEIVTAGNGLNTITTGAGVDSVTVGTGGTNAAPNLILTLGGNDSITVGTGANTLTPGAGSDTVVLGAGHNNIGNVDRIIYTAADQGGAAIVVANTAALATGDTVTGFVAGAASDILNFNAATTGTHAVTVAATNLNLVNTGADTVYVSTTQNLAGAVPTFANVAALIGTATLAAGDSIIYLVQTNAASGVYDAFQATSAAGLAAAAFGSNATDTISLVGTYTITGTPVAANFVA